MTEITIWEYQVQVIGGTFSGVKDDQLEELLNDWGSEGWEVISAHNIEGSNKVRLIAKRQLTAANRRRRDWQA
jgi:hypothetical protein